MEQCNKGFTLVTALAIHWSVLSFTTATMPIPENWLVMILAKQDTSPHKDMDESTDMSPHCTHNIVLSNRAVAIYYNYVFYNIIPSGSQCSVQP